MTSTSIRIIATLATVAVAAVTLTAENTVRVFVFTQAAESGFVDYESQRRTDSVKDLEKALTKKKRIILVANANVADVTVEVMGSGAEAMNSVTTTTTQRRLFGIVPVEGLTSSSQRDTSNVLRIKLSVPGTAYSKELMASKSGIGPWGVLANYFAGFVDKWIKDNGDQIATMQKEAPPPLPVVPHESIMAESIRAASRAGEASSTIGAATERTLPPDAASNTPNARTLVGLDERALTTKIGQPKAVAGVRWTYETKAGDLVVYVDEGKVIEVRPGDVLLNTVEQSQEPPDSVRVRPRPDQRGAVAWCRNGELAFVSTGADTCRGGGGVDVWFQK
jgi:hypothetical protein